MRLSPREEFLIGRLIRQDSKVYEEILDYSGGKIYAFLVFLFANQEEATQTLGSVFIKALHHPLEATPLILQILRYAFREAMLRKDLEGSSPSEASFFEDQDPKTQGRINRILKSMQHLSMGEKAILLMREQLFLSFPEMTWISGIEEVEIKNILHQARFKWRQNLNQVF